MKRLMLRSIFLMLFSVIASKVFAQEHQSLDAEFTAARTNVYVNETIQLTLTITSVGLNIGQDITISDMPGQNELLQIGEYIELAPSVNIVNGVEKRSRKFVCDFRAVSAGNLKIMPTLKLTILTRQRSVFGTSIVNHTQRTLRAKPLNLNVITLPKINRPDTFEGAIGRFSFSTKIHPTQVQVGDLINVTTTIKGKGYLKDVSPIGIPPDAGFKTYDAKTVNEETNTRKFLQTIVVTDTNTTTIPILSFTYFDPEKGKYLTQYSDPMSISFQNKERSVIEKFNPEQAAPSGSETLTQSNSNQSKHAITSFVSNLGKETNRKARISNEQPMYFAPSQMSLITAELPSDSHVDVLEEHKDWSKVQYKNNRGWIPSSSLQKQP